MPEHRRTHSVRCQPRWETMSVWPATEPARLRTLIVEHGLIGDLQTAALLAAADAIGRFCSLLLAAHWIVRLVFSGTGARDIDAPAVRATAEPAAPPVAQPDGRAHAA